MRFLERGALPAAKDMAVAMEKLNRARRLRMAAPLAFDQISQLFV
jgi:hypothetical protein